MVLYEIPKPKKTQDSIYWWTLNWSGMVRLLWHHHQGFQGDYLRDLRVPQISDTAGISSTKDFICFSSYWSSWDQKPKEAPSYIYIYITNCKLALLLTKGLSILSILMQNILHHHMYPFRLCVCWGLREVCTSKWAINYLFQYHYISNISVSPMLQSNYKLLIWNIS